MRYEIKEEIHKHGRKTETQWVIWDNATKSVLVRYGTRERCQELLDRYKAAVEAATGK
jgi:hypothetical protein